MFVKNLRRLSLIMIALGVGWGVTLPSLNAQSDEPEQWLTVVGAQARVDDDVFNTDDYIINLLELNLSDDSLTSAPDVRLWGANAIAYPNLITDVAWQDEQLVWVMTDRTQREAVMLYDAALQRLTTLVPFEADYTTIQGLQWAEDGVTVLFSADTPSGNGLVVQLPIATEDDDITSDPEILFAGHFPYPLLSGGLIYLTPLQDVAIIETMDEDPIVFRDYRFATPIQAVSFHEDDNRLALATGGLILTFEIDSQRVGQVFDGDFFTGESDSRVVDVVWIGDNELAAIVETDSQSQIITVAIDTGTITTHATTSPENPYRFIAITPQQPGIFLPGETLPDDGI